MELPSYRIEPNDFKQPWVGYGGVDIQASAINLSNWIHQKNEQDIIEQFARVDMPGLIRMRDAINKAIEKVSKEEIKPV